MWNITIHALVHLGAILVVDVFFHFLYILTIPNDMKLVKDLSDWSLGMFIFYNKKQITLHLQNTSDITSGKEGLLELCILDKQNKYTNR